MQFAKVEKQITAIVLIGFAVAVVAMAIRLDRSSAKLSETASLQATLPRTVLGFDRNDYPGDEALPALGRTFSFSSYWLNNPPGAKNNSWLGKRDVLARNDFGYLVLFNGRESAELKSEAAAARLGASDANAAAAGATREGFPRADVASAKGLHIRVARWREGGGISRRKLLFGDCRERWRRGTDDCGGYSRACERAGDCFFCS
jgi:hypothetical protein